VTIKPTRETDFESVIEAHLLTNGYEPIAPSAYNPGYASFPAIALAFIRTSQPKEWAKLEALHGVNTEATVLKDLTHWLDTYGTLAVLRNGFKCYGRTLRVAFFKPAHGMNPELAVQYAANRVGVTRQLRYSAKNTNELDLVLSINGIPVVTAELKNPRP
jgi:type I restriction enzyme R subunit